MEDINDLSGLDKFGFRNNGKAFDASVFDNKEIIELVRKNIREYLTKSKRMYKSQSSYGLKHVMERHIGKYVSNGELIYAMYLEGFKLLKDSPNCYFNIKKTDVRMLKPIKNLDILYAPSRIK